MTTSTLETSAVAVVRKKVLAKTLVNIAAPPGKKKPLEDGLPKVRERAQKCLDFRQGAGAAHTALQVADAALQVLDCCQKSPRHFQERSVACLRELSLQP